MWQKIAEPGEVGREPLSFAASAAKDREAEEKMTSPAQTFAAFAICWRVSAKRSRGRRKDGETRTNFRRCSSSFEDVRQRIALMRERLTRAKSFRHQSAD